MASRLKAFLTHGLAFLGGVAADRVVSAGESDPVTLKAYELLNEGRALLRQGRKEQAFAKIRAANELNGNTALGFALGVCGAIELEPKDTADREMRAAIDDDVLDLIVELLGSDARETAEKMKAKLRQQRGA